MGRVAVGGHAAADKVLREVHPSSRHSARAKVARCSARRRRWRSSASSAARRQLRAQEDVDADADAPDVAAGRPLALHRPRLVRLHLEPREHLRRCVLGRARHAAEAAAVAVGGVAVEQRRVALAKRVRSGLLLALGYIRFSGFTSRCTTPSRASGRAPPAAAARARSPARTETGQTRSRGEAHAESGEAERRKSRSGVRAMVGGPTVVGRAARHAAHAAGARARRRASAPSAPWASSNSSRPGTRSMARKMACSWPDLVQVDDVIETARLAWASTSASNISSASSSFGAATRLLECHELSVLRACQSRPWRSAPRR